MPGINKFIFAIHRGGSSVLGGISKACANANGENAVVLGGSEKAFKEVGPQGAATRKAAGNDPDGLTSKLAPNLANWQARHGVFAPIRRADMFPHAYFSDGDIALLNMRDPRDCMVSGYFGFLRLHGKGLDEPRRQALYDKGIDAYVLENLCDRYIDACRDYIALNEAIGGKLTILTYEQMVTDFPGWFRKYYSTLEFGEAKFDKLCSQQAQKFAPPDAEDIDSHKRQMLPGDHVSKLKPETIAEINERMKAELEYFSYL